LTNIDFRLKQSNVKQTFYVQIYWIGTASTLNNVINVIIDMFQ